MTRRLAWFIAVGCTAAAVHLLVVIALVGAAGWRPLAANVGGWLVAFWTSFAGHRMLTFASSQAPLARSARRFFLVSLAGFAANEAAYAVALQISALPYHVTLAIVLVAVAVMTYLLSSRWAFPGSTSH